MKKKITKKLSLGKIKIASLNNNDQAKINGGLIRTTDGTVINPTKTLTIVPTTDPTAQTWCYFCPVNTLADCI